MCGAYRHCFVICALSNAGGNTLCLMTNQVNQDYDGSKNSVLIARRLFFASCSVRHLLFFLWKGKPFFFNSCQELTLFSFLFSWLMGGDGEMKEGVCGLGCFPEMKDIEIH